jgi:hypothetical protein
MDSSFLMVIHGLLALQVVFFMAKIAVHFGLPFHPQKVFIYLAGLSATAYILGQFLTDLNWVPPWIETILLQGSFSLLQQKVFTRLALLASMLCFFLAPGVANILFFAQVVLGGIFLIISVRKARYQRRIYFKFLLFFFLYLLILKINLYSIYVLAEIFMGIVIFYFFLFQHTLGVGAMIQEKFDLLEEETL